MFAQKQDGQGGGSEQERRQVRFSGVPDENGGFFPEIAVPALDSAEFRQLRAGQIERDSALEAGEHRLRDEVHDRSGAEQARDQRECGHHHRGGGGHGCVARRIAPGDGAEGGSHQQRDRRGDGDGGLPRAGDKPEDEAGEQAGIEPRRRRQAGERGVANAGGHQVGRQRDAGDDIAAQPAGLIAAQPADSRHDAG